MSGISERPPPASTAAPRSPARRNTPPSSTPTALVHGCVVTSTIAKGRITRIDTSEALRVAGVIDVLTHENRPHMARTDRSYKEDVSPPGSPFRPLYDDRIAAQRPAGRAGAGRRMGDREVRRRPGAGRIRRRGARDRSRAASAATRSSRSKPIDTRRCREGLAAARSGTTPNTRCRSSITMRWSRTPRPSSARTTASSTSTTRRKGVMNSHKYLASVFGLSKDDLRVLSPYVGGAFGSGLRPQHPGRARRDGAIALKRSVRVVLTRQQMFSLGYRPASIQRVALGATTERHARRHDPRRDLDHVAIRGLPAQHHQLGRRALQIAARRNTRTSSRGSTFRRRATCARRAAPAASTRSNARWTSLR